MGYWNNTVFIRSSSGKEVKEALASLFSQEGMKLISHPNERARKVYEPMQYGKATSNNLWGVALFPGKHNWTVIKTAPLELLGEANTITGSIRLIELCKQLNVAGFMYNLYDSGPEILLEVNSNGEYDISGCNQEYRGDYHGIPIDLKQYEIQFKLLNHQSVINGISLGDDKAEALFNAFGGRNKIYCDNITSVDTLVCHKKFKAKDGETIYFLYQGSD